MVVSFKELIRQRVLDSKITSGIRGAAHGSGGLTRSAGSTIVDTVNTGVSARGADATHGSGAIYQFSIFPH